MKVSVSSQMKCLVAARYRQQAKCKKQTMFDAISTLLQKSALAQ
jgi:hypothetical protein